MRIAVGDYDARYARVTLDGVPQSLCVMADEEAGIVEVLAQDAAGNLILTEDRTGCETRRLSGVVTVTIEKVVG